MLVSLPWVNFFKYFSRIYYVPVGVFVEAAPRPGLLPALYQMDKPGEGSVQTRRLQGCLQVMGTAQKQARHELRDYGEGLKVCRLFSLFYKETKIFLQAKDDGYLSYLYWYLWRRIASAYVSFKDEHK